VGFNSKSPLLGEEVTLGLKIKRVDNDVWEIAQTGVEYYSNNQCGGIHGTVFTRFYDIPDSPGSGQTVLIPLGFSWGGNYYVVDIRGVAIVQGGNEYLPLPFVDFGGSNRSIEFKVNSTEIVMMGGSGQDWQAGGCIELEYQKG